MVPIVATDPKLLDQAMRIYSRVRDKRRADAVREVKETGRQSRFKRLPPNSKETKDAFASLNYQGILRPQRTKIDALKYNSYTAVKMGNMIEITYYEGLNEGEVSISVNDKCHNKINFNHYIKKFNVNPMVGRYRMDVYQDRIVVDLGDYISAG
jgi:hypothetical protein